MYVNHRTDDGAQVCTHFDDIFDVVHATDPLNGRICLGPLRFVDLELDLVARIGVASASSIHKAYIALRAKMEDVDFS